MTLPELRAAASVHGSLALAQFDSHVDTWDAYLCKRYNHRTVFRRAVEEGLLAPEYSIQAGMRASLYDSGDLESSRELGFEVITTDGVRQIRLEHTIERIRERVEDAKIYFSFDVDFCDPAFAPGPGTPEETFRRPLSGAVQRELRRPRQRKLEGEEPVRELERLYSRYALSEAASRQSASRSGHGTPPIVCNEAFV